MKSLMFAFSALLFSPAAAAACGYPIGVADRTSGEVSMDFGALPAGFRPAPNQCLKALYTLEGGMCNSNQLFLSISTGALLFGNTATFCSPEDRRALRKEFLAANARSAGVLLGFVFCVVVALWWSFKKRGAPSSGADSTA